MSGLSVTSLVSSSLRKTMLGAAVALGMLIAAPGLGGGTAQAAVVGPALGTATPLAALPEVAPLAENVRWVCGVWHCWWRPNYAWYVPPYARGWGPPVRPGCFWRRGWGGWAHVCP